MERGSSVVWGDIGSPEHRSLTKLIGSPGERKPPRDSPGESPERTGSRPRCSTTTQTKWRWHRFYKSSTCSNPLLSCWSSETNERELLQRKLPSLITINTKRLKAFPWWVLFFSVFYICEVRVFTCSWLNCSVIWKISWVSGIQSKKNKNKKLTKEEKITLQNLNTAKV